MNRTATAAIGSLASLAVLGMAAPALAAPVAAESNGTTTSVLCGTPAQDAVYKTIEHPAVFQTVEHPAVYRDVPARTEKAWKWQRSVDVVVPEYKRTVTEQLAVWRYDAGVVEFEWARKVEATPGSPAVDEILGTKTVTVPAKLGRYIYEQQQTGNLHYDESPTWNAQTVGADHPNNGNNGNNGNGGNGQDNDREDRGLGWTLIDREVLEPEHTIEVPVVVQEKRDAVSATYKFVDHIWSATNPGGDRVATGKSRAVISGRAVQALPIGQEPDEDGWTLTDEIVDGQSSVETKLFETNPGGAWTPTRMTGVLRTHTVTTPGHTADAPGAPWSKVEGSEIEVEVAPATTELVTAARTEQKLVKAAWTEKAKVIDAVPAGPACETDGDDEPAPAVDVPPAQVPVPPVVAIDPPVVGETPVVVTPPVVVPEQPVVETPAPEVPVAEVPVVEVPAPPIVLGEEVQAPVAPKEDTTAPAVLGVEAKAAPIQAVVKTTTETPRRGTVAVPTSVDAGLSVTAPAPGTDWRNAAGLVALAAGMALYAVPMRRRATVR